MNEPTNRRISVIIPCFKQAHFLPDCIASLQAQTYPNWEAIIVNDGSPDNTREVALGLCAKDHRVRYIEQENQGLSGARNSGVRASHGKYLQFLDADDRLETDKLRVHVEFLEGHPEVDIVYGEVRYFTTEHPDLRDLGPYSKSHGKPFVSALAAAPDRLLDKLVSSNLFAVNCAVIRRQAFDRIGNWNEALHALEDWEYWLRCVEHGLTFRLFETPGALALVRLHAKSMTRDENRLRSAAYDFRLAAGRAVADRKFRLANFKKGMAVAWDLKSGAKLSRLNNLARANFTPCVLGYLVLFLCGRIGMDMIRQCCTVFLSIVPMTLKKKSLQHADHRKNKS